MSERISIRDLARLERLARRGLPRQAHDWKSHGSGSDCSGCDIETVRDALPAFLRLARTLDAYATALASGVEMERQVALWADVENARAAFEFGSVAAQERRA